MSKIEILGAQDERIFVEFSMQELASLGIDRSTLISALQTQNIVRPAGIIQTGNEKLSLRVSGAFKSEQDVRNINFAVGGRMLRLSDIAEVRRAFADPPQPLFRVNGEPAIGLAIAMRDGGDILALGQNIKKVMAEVTANLPIGIEPKLVSGSGGDGQKRDRRVHDLVVAGRRHHHRRQLHQPGRSAGPGHCAGDPADARDRVLHHAAHEYRHAAHIARRAHHRAGAARRRRDDDDRRHAHAAGRGRQTRLRPARSRSGPMHGPCWPARW